ncbi:MAG: YkgJ family cysteine cluster protein [Candidatus Methanoperedens sp.]|nr:YkgJ family cysteine cluster protein [Candidatus Methanoperedens sp.]
MKIQAQNIEQDLKDIGSFSDEEYKEIIREVGFGCERCGKCCTSEFNDHIFLLDEDAQKIIQDQGREYIRPAPYFDLCDNLGRFYVMGYALKTKPNGNCIFYTGNSCQHYETRPRICRIYPYMLHREPDEDGTIDFRQIGGLNEHGSYHNKIDEGACKEILRAVKEYESGFLRQQLGFIEYIRKYFVENNLRASKQMFDRMMRLYQKGEKIEVYVFYESTIEKNILYI